MFPAAALASFGAVAPVTAAVPRPTQVRRRASNRADSLTTSATTTTVPPPALSNPEMGTRSQEFTKRTGAVPYKDASVDCQIYVNQGARDAIKNANAERFVNLIDPQNPKLVNLLNVMERGWDKIGVRAKNAGHHSLWREAFEAGKALLEEAFPEECDPAFGGEVLAGVAFVTDDKKDRAIDFMQRRPKTDFTMSKYNPLGRLHRDPDAIDYKSPGWMEHSMPESNGDDGYSYRYYNVWLSRTPIDPSGQCWESPLCLLLPKDGGQQEWKYDVRLPEDNDDVTPETPQEMLQRAVKNPLSAAPTIMSFFSTTKKSKEEMFEFTDANYMKRGSPELMADTDHKWITHPFVIFDSFDMWHGAAKWNGEEKGAMVNESKDDTRARQEAAKGRVSMELRFRARCKPSAKKDGSIPFSPLSCAYRGGAFTPDTVRPSEGKYDLVKGTVVK
tara:strand:+ start:1835 stop:3169 length:1335 start_codon:yes stop_codon:yes gene_type:complete